MTDKKTCELNIHKLREENAELKEKLTHSRKERVRLIAENDRLRFTLDAKDLGLSREKLCNEVCKVILKSDIVPTAAEDHKNGMDPAECVQLIDDFEANANTSD